jgi:hypothetical protein
VRFLALLLAVTPVLGCINTDPTIFVEPTLSAPAATVASSVLGTGITGGSFQLDLHLGPRASGPSTVTLGEFSIEDAAQTAPIVPSLTVASTPQFPVTVGLDSTVDTSFTFGTGADLLAPSVAAQLCAAAGVVISATINDSLQEGKPTVAVSPIFHPSGCP